MGPPADRPGPGAPGDRAAAVGRGVRRAGGAGPAPGRDHGRSGDPQAGSSGWPARRVRRRAAVHADRRASSRSAAVIDEEIAGSHPMHRLLQGEVGSGKTVVALRAMLRVVDSGGQAALLAPTEVLAAPARPQHRRTARPAGPGRDARRAGRRHADRAADRVAGCGGPAGRPAGCGERRGGHRRRDPRPARGAGAVRRPRAGRRRRAAPVRRRAARGAGGQGRGVDPPAHAGDDRHADPADGGDDRVRRPRDLDAARAARRAQAAGDARGARPGAPGLPGTGLAAGPRGGRPPGARCTSSARGSRPGWPSRTASPRWRPGEADGTAGAAAARAGAAVESVLPELAAGPLAGLRLAALTGRMTVRREGRRDGPLRRPDARPTASTSWWPPP